MKDAPLLDKLIVVHGNELAVPEADAQSYIKSLKFDNLSSEEFDNVWKGCSNARLQLIKQANSVEEILKEWPFYTIPYGYRFILFDFDVAFNYEDFINKWNKNFEVMHKFLSMNVKDKQAKETLQGINEGPSENGKNAALLWAFHRYFVRTKKIVRIEGGKKTVTKFTIRDSQESVLYLGANLQQVEEHIPHLGKTSVNLQPFVYVTDEDICNIQQIGIYFNSYRYMCNNFPTDSELFYNFVESCIYKMKNTKPRYPKVGIISEILL